MKMIPRKCSHPLCDQVFMVSTADFLTKFHASYCKQDFEAKNAKGFNFDKDPRCKTAQEKKDKKCLDMVNSEKMEGSGMEAGEHQNKLKEEKNSIESETEVLNRSKSVESENLSKSSEILKQEKETETGPKQTIIKTEKVISEEKLHGESSIEKDNLPTKGNTMNETSQLSVPESMRTDSEESHSEESNHLSTVLNVEKENSIQSLNESSKLLLGFAKSLIKGKTDDEGEFIQKPMVSDVGMALQCVEGIRNIQKTKLDFLKFSRELQKEMK